MRIAAEWSEVEKWLGSNSATVADLTVRKIEALVKPARQAKAPDPTKLATRLIAPLKALKETDQLKAKQAANLIVNHIHDLGLA